MDDGPDRIIDGLLKQSYDDPADGLGAIAEATCVINAELATLPTADIGDRVRRWVRKLGELARKVATEFDASGFSISVGATGVSVTVNFTIGDSSGESQSHAGFGG